MPNDAYTLGFLVNELNDTLKGGKINKITQSNVLEIVFNIYANFKNYKLCVNLNNNAPKIYLTQNTRENPLSAFSFLMNLRKHLSNSQITNISNVYCERIVIIELLNKAEFSEQLYKLYVELTGKNSNIILTSEGKILAALKAYPLDDKNIRPVFTGLDYQLPKSQDNFCLNEVKKIESALEAFDGENLENFLLKTLKGVSLATVKEIIHVSNVKSQPLSKADIKNLLDTICKFDGLQKNNSSCPVLAHKDNAPFEAFAFEYKSQNLQTVKAKSLLDAYTQIYDKIDDGFKLSQNSRPYRQIIKNNITKLTKKINILTESLKECEKAEKYRIYGELITSNIYRIQKTDKELTCLNYYDNAEVKILLDNKLSPAKNAQVYFKKYNKLKNAKIHSNEQLIKAKDDLEYFSNLETALSFASENADIEQIRSELVKLKLVEEKKQKSKNPSEIKLTKYIIDGFTVLAGKNNIQNDYLTFKTAKPNDIWLHVRGAFGAHVVIISDNKDLPEKVLLKAAEIAAFYSGEKDSEKVNVDYTFKKHVKKPPAGNYGLVTYTNQKTILAKPNQNSEFKQK